MLEDDTSYKGEFLSKAALKELKKTMLLKPSLCDSIIVKLTPSNVKTENRDCEALQGKQIFLVSLPLLKSPSQIHDPRIPPGTVGD